MGYYDTPKNTPLSIILDVDYQDNGWVFENGKAIHRGFNSGTIRNIIFRPVAGRSYTIKLNVEELSGGSLEVRLGDTLFGSIDSAGYFELIATTLNTDNLELTIGLFDAVVSGLQITEGLNTGKCIAYDTNAKQFVGERSFVGDMMERFQDDFISFKNGQPWVHDRNDTRNSFYGVSYPSIVRFYCNINYDQDKDFYSMTINGNSRWRADVTLPPREGKSRGQRSRIKSKNFVFEKGKYVADFLRDMNDPRFSQEMQALMRGAYLQGQIMEVTMTNTDDTEVRMVSVEIDVSPK